MGPYSRGAGSTYADPVTLTSSSASSIALKTADELAPPAPEIDRAAAQRAYDDDRAHVFHSWSAQGALKPMVVAGAQGSWVWDGDGNRYLDFSSQLVNTNIGHQHPAVVAAIRTQAAKLCTVAPQHANDARSEAARLITERAPGDSLNHVFFTNGGAEAIENAVRMARLHTGRRKVLARYRSYHGNTQTAIHLTGDPRRWPNDSAAEGVVHFFGPYLYRTEFNATSEAEECERALAHLRQIVNFEGPQTIAAIVLETIPGTAGIMIPPPGYLAGVREICDAAGIMLISDEVMAGFGRAGEWFAIDAHRKADGSPVVPDLVTFAKGVNSGYVPLGGVIVSDAIYDTFRDRVFPGGLTYSGHPLACAAAVATITAMTDERIVENAKTIGADIIGPALADLAARHPSIGEVRGTGVFWCIEFVRDRETRESLTPYNAAGADYAPMTALVAACKSRGLLPFVNMSRLHVVPPCTVNADETRLGLSLLDEAIGEMEAAHL
jgi:taurine---2-oxoglutarate transaminase